MPAAVADSRYRRERRRRNPRRPGAAFEQPLQFLAKLAVSLLRRIEVRQPCAGIRGGGGLGERGAGIGDVRKDRDDPRNAGGRRPRSAGLFGVGDDGRGDRRLQPRERRCGEAGVDVPGQGEGRQIETIVLRASRVAPAPSGRPGSGRSRRPIPAHIRARRKRRRSPPGRRASRLRPEGCRRRHAE